MRKSFLIEWPDTLGPDWCTRQGLQTLLWHEHPMTHPTVIESVYAGKERRGSMEEKKPKRQAKKKAIVKYVLIKPITIPAGTVLHQAIKNPLDEEPLSYTKYSVSLSTGEFAIFQDEIDEFKPDVVVVLRE